MKPHLKILSRQSGISMVEVLVSLIILLVGLLGLAGLMIQSQRSEMESYQRVQALTLLQDMAGRLNANRNVASCYAFTTNAANGTPYTGTPGTASLSLPPACAVATATAAQIAQFQADVAAWNTLLLGSAEQSGGNSVGVMVGARGCVSYNANTELPQLNPLNGLPIGTNIAGTGIYTVTVVWQGLSDTFASPGLNCGKGLYGATDKQRRAVSLTFRIANLYT